MPRYENDERILKLWLKLAERFPERGLAVMDFAHRKGSCRQLANFYVRWSEMYEWSGMEFFVYIYFLRFTKSRSRNFVSRCSHASITTNSS